MKVTVQRTMEIAEVPFHANNMLVNAIEQLSALSHLSESLDVTRVDDFLKNLDFLRKRMFQVDTKLEECATLMHAYKKTIHQKPAEDEDDEQEKTSTVPQMPQSLDEIKNFYNKALEQNKLESHDSFPKFPDLDLASLQEKKNKIEEILNDE